MHATSYIDLQVNGAFGVDLNDDELTYESFAFVCQRLASERVERFLPTIITDSIDRMCHRIKKIASFVERDSLLQRSIAGIHVEGPFISSQAGYVGTHPKQHVLEANVDDAMRLLDAGRGMVRMVTLAPEQDPTGGVVRRLSKERIVVFAGHTNASRDEICNAIDHGLVGFTHLGNGCAHQVERHDNIVQRVLSLRHQLKVTLIADGVHVPGWLLRSWIDILGTDRCIVISDAMSAAGMPPGEYSIGGQPIQVDVSRRTTHREHGYLAGSASTMQDMDRWMSSQFQYSKLEKERMLFANAKCLLES
jgi:N-acetylglucosamine-6-phosphate deacetylase